MVMAILPAARRHHRSRTLYAFGLLALLGAVGTLMIVAHHPALSATELSTPVPAPEITVADADPHPERIRAVPAPVPAGGVDDFGQAGAQAGAGAGTGTDPVLDAQRATGVRPGRPDDVSRSLFWSGLVGLAISLAGLGLVGARRRRW
jgi:hypothetical protein